MMLRKPIYPATFRTPYPPGERSRRLRGGGEVPEGFEAITQDAVVVTQDGQPVYVAEA